MEMIVPPGCPSKIKTGKVDCDSFAFSYFGAGGIRPGLVGMVGGALPLDEHPMIRAWPSNTALINAICRIRERIFVALPKAGDLPTIRTLVLKTEAGSNALPASLLPRKITEA